MPVDPKRVERVVGLFIIVLIFVTTSLVFMLLRQRDWFTDKFEIRVTFERGVGITQGTQVVMEGIDIGRVKNMSFNAKNQLEGVLVIKELYHGQIRQDSVATVIRTHLLAKPQIDISIGSTNEAVLEEGDSVQATAQVEPTMKDFLAVATNAVTIIRDIQDPKGSFQQIVKNMEEITDRLARGTGTASSMLKDDGTMYRDSREVLGGFNTMLKGQDSVPITLTEESQLIVNLSEKLDKQTDIFVRVADKFDVIAERLLAKDNLGGAVLSDPEFYSQMRSFFDEARALLVDLRQLATAMRTVVPQLPGLIEEGRKDLKEMGKLMKGLQNIPFMNIKEEAAPKSKPLHVSQRFDAGERP